MSESMHLLAGAYSVDALDADERRAFEEHLAGCAECQAEVHGLRATAARLGSAETVAPPESLRRAVMAEVARTAQERPSPSSSAAEKVDEDGSTTAPVVTMPRARPGRSNVLLVAAAAVLAVVAVALGALLVQARSDRDALADRQQQVSAVLTAPDARTVTGEVAGGGRAAVVVSGSRQEAAFLATGLASLPSGRTYQLWLISSDGSAQPAGTFVPGAHGQTAVVLTGDPGTAAAVGLTVEPAGGSSHPTTKPVLAVPLAS